MALRLIVVPAVITLAVTLVRLTGELRHWPAKWFSPETGGIVPSGVSWIFGITWLAAVFGFYFASRLIRFGQGPRSMARAVLFAVLGILIFLGFQPVVQILSATLGIGFPQYLVLVWFFWALAGFLQYFGWPELFKTLAVYAYAARIPVAIIMLFAMLGNWGTHYDYVGLQIPLTGIARYLWLAFFPQLVGWVAFTLTLGTVAGVLALLCSKLFGSSLQEKPHQVDVGSVS